MAEPARADELTVLQARVAELEARLADFEAREVELQEQLRGQRALIHTLRTILDLLPHRIFWKGRDYRFLGCNLAFARDAKLAAPDAIAGKSDEDMPWRELKHIYRADDIAVVEEGRSKLNYEEPLLAADGRRLWLRTSKVPLLDERGVIGGVIGFFEDLTEQHNALHGLRESEERYRNLVEQAQDGIFVADRTGRFTNVNAAGCALLGYTKQEIFGMRTPDLIVPEDLAQVPLRASRAGQRLLTQRRLVHKDGTIIPTEINSTRLPDGTFEAIVRDIRPRAREEEQRRKLEEELRHAQRMESMGRLAGGIAHDFNNLLLVIIANAHLLKRREPSAPTRELDGIMEASERASRLTRQLLAFSRKRVLKPTVLDVNEIVRGLSGMLERLLGEDIVLGLDLSETRCLTLADATQLEQVVMNLAVNARDAMTSGGRVLVRTQLVHDESSAPREVLLRVEDTGHGMDASTVARIFEPFFTTKDPGEGTGLGLSMVYGIVTQNGGTIEVKSAPGQGTIFEIRLPATDQNLERPRGEREGAIADKHIERACVLLVEDDDAVRETLAHMLRDAGYRVLAARGGEDALRIARSDLFGFDLLLSDVVMTSLSGPLVAERLLAERVDLPVLLMSGYSDKLFSDGHLDERMSFLEKPFSPETLLARVAELLR